MKKTVLVIKKKIYLYKYTRVCSIPGPGAICQANWVTRRFPLISNWVTPTELVLYPHRTKSLVTRYHQTHSVPPSRFRQSVLPLRGTGQGVTHGLLTLISTGIELWTGGRPSQIYDQTNSVRPTFTAAVRP